MNKLQSAFEPLAISNLATTSSLKILFLCTAHNSLSQRLSLVLKERGHRVTVELALSAEIMVEAANLATPDVIICPYLTKKVPSQVFERYLTLIIHPGPPGDAGPSAIDWVLLGDDGSEPDPQKTLQIISTNDYVANNKGRSHWGVTVLQAIEEFDAGPVWAWDQFPIVLDGPQALTKASLYRGPVTTAALAACLCAIDRILSLINSSSSPSIHPGLIVDPCWATKCVTTGIEFLGGKTHTRPLLKATQRAWSPETHSAAVVSRRLRASDSQPGVQCKMLFDQNLYLYGGLVEENPIPFQANKPGDIVAQRDSAILILTADKKAVWITHIRRLKQKNQTLLPSKLPAILGLRTLTEFKDQVDLDAIPVWGLHSFTQTPGTFQEVWIEYESFYGAFRIAFIYSNFYNGAASTSQCEKLLAAITEATNHEKKISALVLMGGDYWNNGIHLGVCSIDVTYESWKNINAINDCVKAILEAQNIVTFAAIRGNAAAGGFALATCCDFVFCVGNAVINPHYRAVGLYGSEYHSLTWYARAGEQNAKHMMRGMLPMSAKQAKNLGLVDQVIEPSATLISDMKRAVIRMLLTDVDEQFDGAPWTKRSDHQATPPERHRVIDAIVLRKRHWFKQLPQPLSCYRKQELDFMKLNFTDLRYAQCVEKFAGKATPAQTPYRFALHRRYGHWDKILKDPEESENYFTYQNVDSHAVHKALELAESEAILLVSPPPLSPCPSVSVPTKRLSFSKPYISPVFSEATTLVCGSPSNPQLLSPARSPRCQDSDGRITTFREPSQAECDQSNGRISRVVKILKSAFKVDDSESPAHEKRLSKSPKYSPGKTKSSHQMTCYYNEIDQ
ncbi:hypothetical protein O181_030760 [Austropuccinia psidii MF-1]|uniref:Formyl transferase C-terminal domain-containing protein n=1 Tax=Austropuccinia psidii MF-1 TaxID=1389203 RepID=A0A9Q3CXT3_9BASI|nr:hypothetical protein [Austropuccinia psidii MF-1]